MTNESPAVLAPVDVAACPWCGGTIPGDVAEGSSFRWRKVIGCCADGPEVRHNTMADDQKAAEVDSRRRAVEAWNERKPVEQMAADLAAAREENALLRNAAEREKLNLMAEASALRQRAEAAEAGLRECFRLAGGDTECSGPDAQVAQAVDVVRDLRECYDEWLDEPQGDRHDCD